MIYTDTIQTVEHLSGTLAYKVRRSASVADTPSFASLRIAGPLVERVDVVAGDLEIREAQFEFNEETQRYWLNVLAGETAEIVLEMTQGATTTVLFWGKYVLGSVTMEEYDHFTMQRKGTFRCVSVLSNLRDVDSQTVFDACYNGGDMIALTTYNGLSTAARIMNVKRFLARIMEQLNGSLDEGDIVVDDLPQDVQYSVDGSTWYDWRELYFWCGSQNPAMLSYGWFQPEEWKSRFPSAFEMLVGVLRGVMAVPVYYYDYAASRHRIRVMTRGHSASGLTPLTMGRVIESTLYPDVSHGIRVVGVKSGWTGYLTNPYGQSYYHSDTGINSTVRPGVGLDLEQDMYWLGNTDAYTPLIELLLRYTSGTTAVTCGYIRFWDYDTNDWATGTQYGTGNGSLYLSKRFSKKRFGYLRTYEGIGPTTGTQDDLYLMVNHDIDDEVPFTRHFYAMEISREIEQDTVEVKWEQI
jgi:hypothetical protein